MGFDKNLPLKDRLRKRRREKRKKLILFLAFIVVTGSLLLIYGNNAWSGNDRDKARQSDINDSDRTIIMEDQEIPLSEGKSKDDDTETDSINTLAGNSEPVAAQADSVSGESDSEVNNDDDDEILESSPLPTKNSIDYKKLEDELKAYISKFKGKYGIYYYDLVNGDSFGINESEEFTAASTFKVPLNLYVYKGIKEGKINPEGTLKYTEADYEGGAGIIQNEAFGKIYTVRELSRYSLVYSDNVATRMLIRLVGRPNVKKFMREMGGSVVSDSKNVSCPKDMGLYLRKVHEFCSENGKIGEELLKNMIETDFHDRLPLLLPKDLKIAHKTGNLIGIVHDVGIIYTDKPYILAVMSKDVISDEETNTVIANISKKVYDYVKDR